MKVTIETISKATNRLVMVKLIKDCTGLDLRQSKFIMEDLEDRKVEIEVLDGFYLPPPTYQKITYIDRLKEVLNNGSTGGKYIISYFDLESIREYKLLSLGIGERIDYENFMLYKMRNENDEKFLELILKKLSIDDLIEIFKEIKI
jgi:hypothetical protein